ncbi:MULTISPECIES: glycosyltransferase family A protein [unclassified Microbacterium]|uniref:glycosyltransferase family A protein n=1 Tax=unclassified Microbacterium TaxID=2609290 RepID=UPI0012F89BD2|nr:glycosyltransferase family A protein [Microbacterium sp. MAH-37]MVQ42636.1 glycosyltransferase family 2 protein [Microbacterium sp. MAH-37]
MTPGLVFVTSLRHPQNSTDYTTVENMLAASLASWLRQTSPRFAIIVVGNRRPPLPDDSRVEFVQVGFPPPSETRGPRTGIAAVLRDKGTKLAIGLGRARELGASHVMFADADDFVSRRLAVFVDEHPDAPGWTITDGWRINLERRTMRPETGTFQITCGSSHIVRTDLLPPTPDGVGATQEQLYAAMGTKLERWIGSHMHLHDDLPLETLPFPGAMYRVGTGESHSGNAMAGRGRPIPRGIAEEFGVPATPRTPWAQARAALPSSRAIRERLLRSR